MHRSSLWNRPVDPGSTQGSHRPISSMRNKYRTRERPNLKLVELSINNDIVDLIQTPYQYILLQMGYCTKASNERVWRITQLAKLSLNHPSVVLTADVFQYFRTVYLVCTIPRIVSNDCNSSALCASRPCSRREAGPFVCFFPTVPACLDLTRGGPARWPARGLVRRA